MNEYTHETLLAWYQSVGFGIVRLHADAWRTQVEALEARIAELEQELLHQEGEA